jgi:N-acetylglutamate synthase-like GNAT family acetyltransferase
LLLENAVRKARAEGALHLYLTADATHRQVAERLGFDTIDRKDVATAITATVEFQTARSKTAGWMRREL